MSTASQEYVNSRVFPIENEVKDLKEAVEALRVQLTSRDADWASAEKRFEEVARQVDRLDKDRQSEGSDAGADRDQNTKVSSILRNQAFRNLESYTGNHLKYGKWSINSMRNSAFKWNMDFVFAWDHIESPNIEGQKPPKDT